MTRKKRSAAGNGKSSAIGNPGYDALNAGSGARVHENDSVTVILNELTLFQFPDSDTPGTFVAYAPSDPSNSINWGSYADIYKEYRVLSMEAEWIPVYRNSVYPTTTTGSVGFSTNLHSVIDHTNDSLSALTVANAQGYETLKVHPANVSVKRMTKMMGIEETVFDETSGPVNRYSVCYVVDYVSSAATLSAATAAATLYVRRKVQFRVREKGVLSAKDARIKELEGKLATVTKKMWSDVAELDDLTTEGKETPKRAERTPGNQGRPPLVKK